MDKAWAGVDAGKEFHWAHCWTLRAESCSLRKVQNDEADISRLIEKALSFAEEVVWAVDQPGGGAALLLALLWERNQRVLNVPGLSVDGARDVYPVGSLKPMPAMRIRHRLPQARMRSDLSQLRLDEQEIPELQLLLIRRRDIVTDHSRILTHLRGTLVSLFPALELALKLNGKGLLTHYQTAIHLRRAGQKRVATYPRETAASKDPIT